MNNYNMRFDFGEYKDIVQSFLNSLVNNSYATFKKQIKDGKIQEYIVESELRITKKYDNIIKSIQEDLESITIKIGLGP